MGVSVDRRVSRLIVASRYAVRERKVREIVSMLVKQRDGTLNERGQSDVVVDARVVVVACPAPTRRCTNACVT